ncbi:ASCH domain-containing protein [Pandoraea anhela]|uniref:RNA-binding protein n=1 Tax=Pandoraea anhela TaxID=2508295 RepID=A0A5E4YF58_9BURK|nr:hypothetical protein PAN31108_04476 [Pandoraea anhela]
MRTLTIPVKGIYFDQIKAGTKSFEYRLRTGYWVKRLVGQQYDRVVLTRGYPKANDLARRIELPWRGYIEKTIKHPHFGSEPVPVFAIRVSVVNKGYCVVCGHPRERAVHLPPLGSPEGSPAWGHEFVDQDTLNEIQS